MITEFARCRRVAFGLMASLSVVSCVSPLQNNAPPLVDSRPLPDNVPPLVESLAQDVVAVIDVTSVRFYERTGGFGYPHVGPNGEDQFEYASDPPFQVRARVIAQLYGPDLGLSVTFKTHSHWGTRPLTNGHLKLVHLVTDGSIIVMPDEHDADAGTDRNGMLVTPASLHDISWLPCGINELKVPMSDKSSTKFRNLTYPDPSDDQKAYFRFEESGKGRSLYEYPRYGIPIHQLAAFLQTKHPRGCDFRCLGD